MAKRKGATAEVERKPRAKPRKKAAPLAMAPQRQPLVEAPVVRAELVDLNTSNSNIIQQLRMITAYPYRISEEMRDKVADVVAGCLNSHDPQIRLAAASIAAKLTQVNLGVFKQLASDQVQRHLSFDKRDERQEAKFKALESMTDEELEVMQRLADRMGGAVPIGEE